MSESMTDKVNKERTLLSEMNEALEASGIKTRDDRWFLDWAAYIETMNLMIQNGFVKKDTWVGHFGTRTVLTFERNGLARVTSIRWFPSEYFKTRYLESEKEGWPKEMRPA